MYVFKHVKNYFVSGLIRFEMKTLFNIVMYLPHAKNVESQKPQNMHATIKLQIESMRC
jgi:hypothetical protein